jgi:dethiobiotin synthetase
VRFFVTGTDTGVGKTHTVVQLLRRLRANGRSCAGFKPICCGNRQDAERLLDASANGLMIDQINPVWLKTPAAPLTAAQIEKVDIDVKRLLDAFQKLAARVDDVFVEGVGGWMVPIGQHYFVKDLARDFELPVLVVAQNRLGCLNHTLLTVQSVQAAGLRCAGVVLNAPSGSGDIAETTNADILANILDVPLLPQSALETAELSPEWTRIMDFGA